MKMFFGRVILLFAAGVGSLRYGLGLYAWRISNKLEKPAYEVIGRLGKGVELRRYGGYTTAEVNFVHPESMKAATSQGFKKVAGFIFGKNRNRGSRLSHPSEGRGAAMANDGTSAHQYGRSHFAAREGHDFFRNGCELHNEDIAGASRPRRKDSNSSASRHGSRLLQRPTTIRSCGGSETANNRV